MPRRHCKHGSGTAQTVPGRAPWPSMPWAGRAGKFLVPWIDISIQGISFHDTLEWGWGRGNTLTITHRFSFFLFFFSPSLFLLPFYNSNSGWDSCCSHWSLNQVIIIINGLESCRIIQLFGHSNPKFISSFMSWHGWYYALLY